VSSLPLHFALTSLPKKYELKERTVIIKMLGMSLNNLDEDQVTEERIAFVDNLVLIRNRQQCPCKYKGPELEKQQPEHLSGVKKPYKNETIVMKRSMELNEDAAFISSHLLPSPPLVPPLKLPQLQFRWSTSRRAL
jgi:hypothetical protein